MAFENDAKELVNNIRNSLCKEIVKFSLISQKKYHFEFTVSRDNINNKVQVYFGKNGVKVVVQGKDDPVLTPHIYQTIEKHYRLNKPKQAQNSIPDEYIGSDESGKGDFFGPLVTASVYLNNNNRSFLQKLNIKDSKQLTDTNIKSIAIDILNNNDVPYSYSILFPEQYNILYKKIKNLNKLLASEHVKVLKELNTKYDSNIIVDKFAPKASIIEDDLGKEIIFVTNGEANLGVAAASIIARYFFVRWFEEMEDKGYFLLKGASGKVDQLAADIIVQYGEEALLKLAKQHFKTFEKAKNLL